MKTTTKAVQHTAGPASYVYRLRNGVMVHTTCREAYVKRHHTNQHNYPGIEAAIWEGRPMSRFQLCAQCDGPIWDQPANATGGAQ